MLIFRMTICYEGRLAGDNVLDEFFVPNIDKITDENWHSISIKDQCLNANNQAETTHGFRVAVKWVKFGKQKMDRRILVITSSVFEQK